MIKTSQSLKYKEEDFTILQAPYTGDVRILYSFRSQDGKVRANFFFKPGDTEVRGLVGETGMFRIAYPFLNPIGDVRDSPGPRVILRSIINQLARGNYEED